MSAPLGDGAADRASPEPEAESRSGGDRAVDTDIRLSRLEGRFDTLLDREVKYLATKEDIEKLKVWVLMGVIAGIIAIATAIVAVVY